MFRLDVAKKTFAQFIHIKNFYLVSLQCQINLQIRGCLSNNYNNAMFLSFVRRLKKV